MENIAKRMTAADRVKEEHREVLRQHGFSGGGAVRSISRVTFMVVMLYGDLFAEYRQTDAKKKEPSPAKGFLPDPDYLTTIRDRLANILHKQKATTEEKVLAHLLRFAENSDLLVFSKSASQEAGYAVFEFTNLDFFAGITELGFRGILDGYAFQDGYKGAARWKGIVVLAAMLSAEDPGVPGNFGESKALKGFWSLGDLENFTGISPPQVRDGVQQIQEGFKVQVVGGPTFELEGELLEVLNTADGVLYRPTQALIKRFTGEGDADFSDLSFPQDLGTGKESDAAADSSPGSVEGLNEDLNVDDIVAPPVRVEEVSVPVQSSQFVVSTPLPDILRLFPPLEKRRMFFRWTRISEEDVSVLEKEAAHMRISVDSLVGLLLTEKCATLRREQDARKDAEKARRLRELREKAAKLDEVRKRVAEEIAALEAPKVTNGGSLNPAVIADEDLNDIVNNLKDEPNLPF